MSSPQQPKRRQFFKIASAGTVATASGGFPMLFVPNAVLAAEVLGADAFATLTKMARDIFTGSGGTETPHCTFGMRGPSGQTSLPSFVALGHLSVLP